MQENGMGSTTSKHRVSEALPRAKYLTLLFLSIFRPIKRKFGFTIADLDIHHLESLKFCFLLYLKVYMLRIFIVKCVNLLNTNVYLFQSVIEEVLFLFISFTVIFGVLLLFLMFLGHDGLCHSSMIVLVLLGFSCSNINPMSVLFSQIFVL